MTLLILPQYYLASPLTREPRTTWRQSDHSRKPPYLPQGAGLFRGATLQCAGEVAPSGAEEDPRSSRPLSQGKNSVTILIFCVQSLINASKSIKCISAGTKDMVQSSHQPPAINIQTKAKVQKLAPNRTGSIQKVSGSTPNQHVPQVTQLSIIGLPIVHLSISQENPPWTLPL